MLIITGTQRSGTSAVAKMFIEEGYMKETFWDDEAKGGYEHPVIANFYRWYLGDDTFPFNDFPFTALLSQHSLEDLEDEVVKFSYLLMNPTFIYIWHKFRPETLFHDKFLILYRVPQDVVASKVRVIDRFVHDSLLLKQSQHELKFNYSRSLASLRTLNYPYLIYPFEYLFKVQGPQLLQHTLDNLGVDFVIRQETFNKVLKPEWRHY